ncbi:DgyrCDS14421 [Dimorphilus gyrociliatus]|uniref:DgyrCDS14421 n=1 Tax=Dimorphilus gyrociliatus TaxID=2664684 RepID=A0A7I8WDU9_9ANNE|nr:DgyrCDS14421 [Dimorphilus gyrociliatus]
MSEKSVDKSDLVDCIDNIESFCIITGKDGPVVARDSVCSSGCQRTLSELDGEQHNTKSCTFYKLFVNKLKECGKYYGTLRENLEAGKCIDDNEGIKDFNPGNGGHNREFDRETSGAAKQSPKITIFFTLMAIIKYFL